MTGISEGPRPGREPEPARGSPDGGPGWPVDFDPDALLAAAVRSSASGEADQEAILAAELESREQEDDRWAGPAGNVDRPPRAGEVAEGLPAGPGLAAWLARQEPAALTDWDLPAVAAACRKLASWAQARELATVSRIAVRSAEDDDRIGLADDGRPAHVSADAAAQVSLGLTLSPYGGEAWAHLAVTLQWRLARTGRALADGTVDLYRARVIADATALLSQEAARAVEDTVLARAGDLTYGQLHAAVRRAVIAADPEGAERRRQAAERQSKVSLYPDQACTAALSGTRLPAGHATAAMARISAMAQALKASGAGGGIDLLRAQVFLGLLLGTLPLIPPPHDGPPDSEPPPDDHDGTVPSGDCPRGSGPAADDEPAPGSSDGRRRTAVPVDDADPPDDGYLDTEPDLPDSYARWDSPDGGPPGDDPAGHDLVPAWPPVPPAVPAVPGSVGAAAASPGSGVTARGRPPPGGLLDLTLPWSVLTGEGSEPGTLGRIGPITAPQACELAWLAALDHRGQWRVILTDSEHHAIAAARIPRERRPSSSAPPSSTGVVGRVTVILAADDLDRSPPRGGQRPAALLAEIAAAARRARDRARQQARADQFAPGGCAHATASPAYQPPPRIREHVIARDGTCRNPVCGQPAWRADLDHTRAHHLGGRTCPCNLGGVCRRDHQLKQHPGWTLVQVRPGYFEWTTPAGRTYPVEPHCYQ